VKQFSGPVVSFLVAGGLVFLALRLLTSGPILNHVVGGVTTGLVVGGFRWNAQRRNATKRA
jgi:hypothetical protein